MLVIIITSMLLLTACNSNQQITHPQGIYLGGTLGIVTKFQPFGVTEDSIYSIFDSETFPLEVTFTNKGEYNIKPGDVIIKLLGPSEKEFSGIANWELKNKDTVEKISELTPNGGEETISFASDAKYLGAVTGAIQRTWFANVEYKYQTYAIVPEVCLKEDLTDKRVCEVKDPKKAVSVSGAPITITNVEEDTSGKGIMALKFKIKNIATGKVTAPAENFSPNTDKLAFFLDDTTWECKSAGKVNEARLVNGEAEIVCKLKEALPKGTLSTKQVQLTLDYKYRDIISEKIQIKQSVK